MAIETASTCPLTLSTGTFSTQIAFTTSGPFLQSLQMALAAVAEYIVNQESSSDTNYADRALFARMIAANPVYWSGALASIVSLDAATINGSSTDQDFLNRVWTLWPVWSYKASTVYYAAGGISGSGEGAI